MKYKRVTIYYVTYDHQVCEMHVYETKHMITGMHAVDFYGRQRSLSRRSNLLCRTAQEAKTRHIQDLEQKIHEYGRKFKHLNKQIMDTVKPSLTKNKLDFQEAVAGVKKDLQEAREAFK